MEQGEMIGGRLLSAYKKSVIEYILEQSKLN